MRIPQIKRLLNEDYPDQQDWIGKLLTPLNQFLQAVTNGLDKDITFDENIACQLHTATLNNNSSELPLRFRSTLRRPPRMVFVGRVQTNQFQAPNLAQAVGINWEFDSTNNQIVVNSLPGLQAEAGYIITFLVI